ncbi:transposase [Verrucomicrobiales bacterium BCK34]|nr:transposase [Verrucomicrobiales bacterium BCK34]
MTISRFYLDPPTGFRGLDPHGVIECYERNLPHWRQEGATYAVTFRLADSLPQDKLRELKAMRVEFETALKNAEKMDVKEMLRLAFSRETMSRTEFWLDQGLGACLLRCPENRERLREALFYFSEERYELGAFVIMPNHVHAILRPLDGFDLERILQSIKRESAKSINAVRGSKGVLWQQESHDRIIRDGEHLWRCLQYLGSNPTKAGLSGGEEMRWVSEKWQSCGWNFVDKE